MNADFFAQPALSLAPQLLGRDLCRRLPTGRLLRARICETEAYHQDERACHAFGGRKTPRNAVMFGQGGYAYVYFVYGMHWMFNVVAGQHGVGEAVLVRAAVPLEGLDAIAALRGFGMGKAAPRDVTNWLNGPAKVAQGLALTGAQNGRALEGSYEVWIAEGQPVDLAAIATGPRIGVDYAGEDALLPWRFWAKVGA